jgi:peptidoglycan/LPS O-acetylase OafA/YrhL
VTRSSSAALSTKASPLYIPSLDGIRALAVMLVFAAHAVTIAGAAPRLKGVVPGEFGVTVFFFLSGYLITTLLRMEHAKTGRVSLRAFYLRRVLRIFPPLYLVLFATTALTLMRPVPDLRISLEGVLAQATYLTNYYIVLNGWWTGHAPGTWIFWSLAVEEHFYLLFPLLYLVLLRRLPSRQRQALVLAGICAAVLAWRFVLVYGFGAHKDRVYVATDTRIDSIMFGCILGVVANPVLDSTIYSDRWWKYVWVPLALIGLLVSFVVKSSGFQWVFAYSLQGICLFPLFIAAVRYPNWGPFQLLNLGWVKFVGVVSYSIYLMHPAVLWAMKSTVGSGYIAAALALALTLGLAYAIYQVVEKPAGRLRRRLSKVDPPKQQHEPGRTPSLPLRPQAEG